MTEFEFYSVGTSIILALALGKLVAAIPSVFSRTRFDWLFALLFVVTVLIAIFHWTQIWQLHTHNDWSRWDFLLLVGPSIALYLAVYALVGDAPSATDDWEDHLARVHGWFFAALLTALVIAQVRDGVLIDSEMNWPVLLLVGPVLAAGIVFRQRYVHAAIAAAMLVVGAFQFY